MTATDCSNCGCESASAVHHPDEICIVCVSYLEEFGELP